MFSNSKEDYLFNKIQQVEGSLDRRTKSIFALISELQDQVIELKQATKFTNDG